MKDNREFLEEDWKKILNILRHVPNEKYLEKVSSSVGEEEKVLSSILKKLGKEVWILAKDWKVQVAVATLVIAFVKSIFKYTRNVLVAKEDPEYTQAFREITGKSKIRVMFTDYKTDDVVSTYYNIVATNKLKEKLNKDELVAYLIVHYEDMPKFMVKMLASKLPGMAALKFFSTLENMFENKLKNSVNNPAYMIGSIAIKMLIFEIVNSLTKTFFERKLQLFAVSRSSKKYGIEKPLRSALIKLKKDEDKPQPDTKVGRLILKLDAIFKKNPSLESQINAVSNDPEKMEVLANYTAKRIK